MRSDIMSEDKQKSPFDELRINWKQLEREKIDWEKIGKMIEIEITDEMKPHIIVPKCPENGGKAVIKTQKDYVVVGEYNPTDKKGGLSKDNIKKRMPNSWKFLLDTPDISIVEIEVWKPWVKMSYNEPRKAFQRLDHKMEMDIPGLNEYSPNTKYYKIILGFNGTVGYSNIISIWASENYSFRKNEFYKTLNAPKMEKLYNNKNKSLYAIHGPCSNRTVLLEKHVNEARGNYHWTIRNNLW